MITGSNLQIIKNIFKFIYIYIFFYFSNPKPSHEALKGINHLESLLNSKQYYDLKVELDLAITQIQNPENSLHNARNLLCQWTLGLYRQPYLHILKS